MRSVFLFSKPHYTMRSASPGRAPALAERRALRPRSRRQTMSRVGLPTLGIKVGFRTLHVRRADPRSEHIRLQQAFQLCLFPTLFRQLNILCPCIRFTSQGVVLPGAQLLESPGSSPQRELRTSAPSPPVAHLQEFLGFCPRGLLKRVV